MLGRPCEQAKADERDNEARPRSEEHARPKVALIAVQESNAIRELAGHRLPRS